MAMSAPMTAYMGKKSVVKKKPAKTLMSIGKYRKKRRK